VSTDPTSLVIGSGPSAAAVALALSERPGHQVTVLDLGGRLEDERRAVRDRLATTDPAVWDPQDLDVVTQRSAGDEPVTTVPQKRTYGSAYPFRDLGQLTGVTGSPGTNLDVTSSAYGGFSTVWGAQLMPFSRSTFDRWPVSWDDIEPHYRAVLGEVPLAGDDDDLAELFPLLRPTSGLPPLGPRTTEVLRRYERHRDALRARGVTVGRARLAFRARDCVRCGLCMTGCPYELIYSAAHTMDRLRQRPGVRVLDGLLVERIGQDGEQAVASCRDVRTGQRTEFRADRLFVGAGGLGTTRLVLGSLAAAPSRLEVAESVQFVVPFVSTRPVEDPRGPGVRDFTLNQFNVLLHFDDEGYTTSQVHAYPYNPAFADALPAPLRRRWAAPAARAALRRLSVGFGYLPSWASPPVTVVARRGAAEGLPELELGRDGSAGRPELLGRALRRLVRAAPRLDLWPLLTHVTLSGAAKSYHFGGAFPHSTSARPGRPTTDTWGRLPDWDRVHLVDGSVLPSVPSTTFTLTVMANAHRIASGVLAGQAPAAGRVGSASR
jgi:choline dehydrogenase-like flavoprotein